MTAANHISAIALNQNGYFTRKDILNSGESDMKKMSEGALAVLLNRMLADEKIVRVSHGKYRLNDKMKPDFVYNPGEFVQFLSQYVKDKFPFVEYCVWQPSALVPLMQHFPSVKMTLVDVERDAMEPVFLFLQAMDSDSPILLNPSKAEAERYITNKDIIIVRPLVKEAPLETVDGCAVPSLEKMLVDAVSDRELQHLQGNELYTIYSNAFSDYNVRKPRLLRYASRRNRKDKVVQILNYLNIL